MGGGEEQAGEEILALGPILCEVGKEVRRLLKAEMKGMNGNQ